MQCLVRLLLAYFSTSAPTFGRSLKPLINGEANNFKMKLFNDIHEGSGAY